MSSTAKNEFLNVRNLFLQYFSSRGYQRIQPIPMQKADSKKSFLRSINSRPAYEYIKLDKSPFGHPRICIPQPVVRPEDFLAIDLDPKDLDQGLQTITDYRCGTFEMLAAWHSGPPVGNANDQCDHGSAFLPLVSTALNFFRDELALDPKRMWFSLWPGGQVANGKGYIPPATDCLEFLQRIWGAENEQIAWDPDNIWPDPPNQDVLDPDRTGLVAPRLEMYYQVAHIDRSRCYPKNTAECAQFGYMELLSAIPLKWINDKETGEFSEIPIGKMVAEVAFGLERAAMCVEEVSRVRDIGFYKELRELMNEVALDYTGHFLFHEADDNAYFTFCKVADRLRLLIMASYQGVDFGAGSRGATLKMYARELFEILRTLGLDNRAILAIEERAIQYLAQYYPFLSSPECQSMNDFVFQQLNPAFVAGKKYSYAPHVGVQEKDIIFRLNKGLIHRPKPIPEIEA